MTTQRHSDGPEALFQRRAATLRFPEERRRSSSRLGQWLVAVLMVVTSVTAAAWLYVQKGSTTEVLVVSRPIAAGHVLSAADLETAEVSGIQDAIAVIDADGAIGQVAAVALVPGQVLTTAALTSSPVPAAGERLVALSLPAGRLPSGLAPGSAVEVLAAPAPGQGGAGAELKAPEVLAPQSTVFDVVTADDGTLVVTLRVPDEAADSVAAHSAAGRVTLVQIPVGG